MNNTTVSDFSPQYLSVGDMLTHHAHAFPQKEAIVTVDVDLDHVDRISYGELYTYVIQTANYFYHQGIRPTHRIAILMHNSAEIVLCELAAGLLGATVVPLDYKRDTLERKLFKITDTHSRVLFVKTDAHTDVKEVEVLRKKVSTSSFSSFAHFIELISTQSNTPVFKPTPDLSSTYLILYTSGTTALPKGVILSTRALFANAEGIITWQKLTSTERFNIILPLHHINSTTMSLATLISGGTIILNSRYSASRFWEVIGREHCTITSVVPTVIHDLLMRHNTITNNTLHISSLKRILIGSAPVLPEETLRFYETFKIKVIQGYGQTETALRVTGTPLETVEKKYIHNVQTNTIGIELKNCQVTILKPDGAPAREKETGEICIKGPVLADGYLNNPDETKKAFSKGWFHSGDIGYYQIQNHLKYFFIIGRLKEIIIKGGVNLSPAMIEDTLLTSFSEIDEVSVVGFSDERMGEEVAAVIVLKRPANVQQTIQKILDQGLAGKIFGLSTYEAPKKVFLVEKLPKTSTGKIQRVEVKKMISEMIKAEKTIFSVVQIEPYESKILKQVLEINNERWQGLPSTLKEFTARAQNGLLFGVFDDKENLLGSISCVQLSLTIVEKLKTWNEATNNGTLTNHDPKGNTLLCVAISVRANSSRSEQSKSKGYINRSKSSISSDNKLTQLAHQKIEEYVNSDKDHVLNFHRKPKGGLSGANVWKILENGRPEDQDSFGYNVLMKYPQIPKSHKISHVDISSPSTFLIEHVLEYAQKKGIKNVIAFSRPAGFKKWLLHL